MSRLSSIILLVACLPAHLLLAQPQGSLSGQIADITGAVVVGAKVELVSWGKPSQPQRTSTDQKGQYLFSALADGDYALTLSSPGFHSLRVNPVSIRDGNSTILPALELEVGEPCSGRPHVESIRFLPSGSTQAAIAGSVEVAQWARSASIGRISRARVELLCSPTRVCGTTLTGVWGQFRFDQLKPIGYGIRVTHPGFYPIEQFGYGAKQGIETTYRPIAIEPCSKGNCDPKLRLIRPFGICE